MLTLAGWSTGADCTAQTSASAGCAGKLSYWGGNAGRERGVLLKYPAVASMLDMVNVMSYDARYEHYDGVVAYDELLRLTDPKLVTMEMDLAWVVTAGVDPVKYLKKHAERISLLHVKEVRKDLRVTADRLDTQTTEVGSGQIDWKRVFKALDPARISHYFVEQENFERLPLEAVRISFDYLKGIGTQR